MKFLNLLNAICFSAGMAFSASAFAAPTIAAPGYDGGLVVQVRGCHSNVQRHHVPQYGRSMTHRHLRNCRPIRVTPGHGHRPRDCHRDVRRHHIPGYRGRVSHRHVGPRCVARIYR